MTRRGLLPRLPSLTKFYGLEPASFERMTYREISEYVVQYDRYQAEQAKS